MTLDRDTVVLRLGIMNDLLGDLESIGGVDAARLRSDRITRHAVERILTQLAGGRGPGYGRRTVATDTTRP